MKTDNCLLVFIRDASTSAMILISTKKDTNSSDKHIELVHFDYDLTFRMYSTYIFKSNRENGPDANISTRVKIFRFSRSSAYACDRAATNGNEIPLWHNTSAMIFTTRGYVWPMKTLDSGYLVPAEGFG